MATGYIAAANGYAQEITSKIAIATAYGAEIATRLQADTAKYGWYGDQYTKLSAEYQRGLQFLVNGGLTAPAQ